MAKGPDIERDAHVCAHALQQGTWRLIRDDWGSLCVCCEGAGVYKKRQCHICGGSGTNATEYLPAIKVKIPPGSRPGQKLRVRGYGWRAHAKQGVRGDLIITLRLCTDEEMVNELAAAPAQVLPTARARALPGARVT
ncbi:MAG: DnaJ C-terminal domain-containing protein [Vulcanimicrobiaceae bacterium]